MKTVKIQFGDRFAEQVGILLYSLDLIILMTYTEQGFMDDNTIYCVCKLSDENTSGIPAALQLEKLREKKFLTIVNK